MNDPGIENGTGETLVAEAPAKINLFLLVGGKRPDGYHPLCSLMEKVTLFDRVGIRRTGRSGVRVLGMEIPAPGNTVFKAAMILEEETGIELDIEVKLDKRIPEAAGLAGGSSDAAAVLELLNRMYRMDISPSRLAELALRIGADVPFFLQPGSQLAEGTGELLGRPATLPVYHAVIVKPAERLPTADVYELYDTVGSQQAAAFPERRQVHLERLAAVDGSLDSLVRLLYNDLEEPASRFCHDIIPIKEELLSLGASGALMSGSGPSVFGLFKGETEANAAYLKLAARHQNAWLVAPSR
jgi:4-diphosphocytidyl-2-C-methyl-D-erythritol kinase